MDYIFLFGGKWLGVGSKRNLVTIFAAKKQEKKMSDRLLKAMETLHGFILERNLETCFFFLIELKAAQLERCKYSKERKVSRCCHYWPTQRKSLQANLYYRAVGPKLKLQKKGTWVLFIFFPNILKSSIESLFLKWFKNWAIYCIKI